MNITPTDHREIIKYIDGSINKRVDKIVDKAVDKAVKKQRPIWKKNMEEIQEQWKRDTERFLGALHQDANHEIKTAAEIAKGKPDEERVREIFHEEIKPLKSDITIIKNEVRAINTKLSSRKTKNMLI